MKGKRARTGTPRLGLEVPDVLLPDIRDHPMQEAGVCRVLETEAKDASLLGMSSLLGLDVTCSEGSCAAPLERDNS